MCNLHWLALTLTDWYANICKKLLPISKHFAKIVTKAVFVLNFANCIDIDRLRAILWRIWELGWGRGPNKKGGERYQTSLPPYLATCCSTSPSFCPPSGFLHTDSFEEGVGEGEGTQHQGWRQVPNPSPHFHNCSCFVQLPLYFYFSPQDGSSRQSTWTIMGLGPGIAPLVFWALKSVVYWALKLVVYWALKSVVYWALKLVVYWALL